MRTARSRTSVEKRVDFLRMSLSTSSVEPPGNPGRFNEQLGCSKFEPAANFVKQFYPALVWPPVVRINPRNVAFY